MGGVRRVLAFSAGMAVGVSVVGLLLPLSITFVLIRKAERKILGI